MKIYFSQKQTNELPIEEDYSKESLRASISRIRNDLEIAYSGFDYATDPDMIDCYIYRINALQKQYKHLSDLVVLEDTT